MAAKPQPKVKADIACPPTRPGWCSTRPATPPTPGCRSSLVRGSVRAPAQDGRGASPPALLRPTRLHVLLPPLRLAPIVGNGIASLDLLVLIAPVALFGHRHPARPGANLSPSRGRCSRRDKLYHTSCTPLKSLSCHPIYTTFHSMVLQGGSPFAVHATQEERTRSLPCRPALAARSGRRKDCTATATPAS